MDPQLKSVLTSVALAGATSIAAWAASKGIIPNGDQSVAANQLVTLAFGAAAALIGWYKSRQMSQKAMIAAVNNADNGVKVVDAKAPAPTVFAPLKEPTK